MDDKRQEHGNRNPGQDPNRQGQTEEERRREEQQRRNSDVEQGDPNQQKDREKKIA